MTTMSASSVAPSAHGAAAGSTVRAPLAFWLLLPAAVAVFGVVLYPIARTLLVSLFKVDSALATSTPFVGLGNYTQVLGNPAFWSSVGRTLYFTIVSTAIELVLGLAVAGLLNARLRARWVLRTIVVIPWALPTIVNTAMWRGIYNAQYGALNALLTQLHLISGYQAWLGDPTTALNLVIVADAWKTIPLVAFFLLAGLTSIPQELYKSRDVDRASWPRRSSARSCCRCWCRRSRSSSCSAPSRRSRCSTSSTR